MTFKKLFARKKSNRRESRANAFVLESLEPRLLLSAAPMTAAVVTTDHLDYAPGETAVITTANQNGDGLQFAAGELVRFHVSRTDGMPDAAGSTPDVGPAGNEAWYVVDGVGGFTAHLGSDVSGDSVADWIAPDNDLTVNSSISTTWFVEEQYRNSSLLVTAQGQESGAVATQAFTDANINTTTVVSSSAPISTYGETVTFTATVTAAAGTIGPVGSVEFFDDGVSLGSDFTASSGGGLTSVFSISRSSLSGGSHSITAVFTGATVGADTFRPSTSLGILQTVNKADAVVNVNGYFAEYDGMAHGATGTATGVGGEDLSAGLDLGATFTNTADNIATWTFSGGTNYNDQSGTVLIKIVKTDPTLTVTGFNAVYSATPPGPSGTPQGLFQDNSPPIPIRPYGTVLDLTATGIRNSSNEDSFRYVDTFYSADQDVTVTVTGAPAVDSAHYFSIFLRTQNPNTGIVNAYYVTYEDAGAAAGNWWIGRLVDNQRAAPGYSSGTHLTAGDKVRATVVGDTITGYSFHNGVWTEEISYTMTGADIVSGPGRIGLMISGGGSEVNLTDVTGVFGAAAHGVTGTATGVLGEPLAGLDLSGTVHTDAGTYFDTWTFKDPTGNYHDTFDAIVVSSIAKADVAITVTGYNVVFDGTAHQATGTALGVLGESLTGLNLTGTTHTNVGVYVDTWTFTDVTGNYNNASGTVSNRINASALAVTSTTVSSSAATSTYGDAVTFTATVSAASGTAAPTGTVEFFDGATSMGIDSIIDSTGTGSSTWSITTASLPAGTHAIRAVYSATGPFLNSTSGEISQTVNQKSLVGSFTAANKVYDTTTDAVLLTQTLAGVLAGDVGSLSLTGGTATFADKNVGNGKTVTLTGATLTGAGASNYVLTSINQTTADITALGITGNFAAASKVYDGTTGAVVLFTDLTGIFAGDDVSLNGSIATFNNVNAGLNKTVTLTGATLSGVDAGNYSLLSVNTTTADIDQAVATVSVTGYTGTYDGAAHGATGTVTGVDAGGVALGSSLNLGASFTNAPGGTVNWTFDGGTNYTNQNGSVAIMISKANIAFTVTGYAVRYDGAAHTATATAIGVNGEDLSAGVNLSGTTHTNVGTGVYLDTVTYTDQTGNYFNATKLVKNYVSKANIAFTVTGYAVRYDGAAHTATATAIGVNGEDLSAGVNVSGTTHTAIGTYLDTVTFTDVTGNYKNASKLVKNFII